MLRRGCLIGLASLIAAACGRQAGWYPIPVQRVLAAEYDPGGIAASVEMDDPEADTYIVRDIGRAPGVYRWAFLHPELRFRVGHSDGVHFAAEIAVPEVTFKKTGPVTVSYAIDGKPLGSIRCDHPGRFQVSQPVPPAWAPPGQYLHVTFEATPRWVSPDDGAQLSFLLFQAGFTQ